MSITLPIPLSHLPLSRISRHSIGSRQVDFVFPFAIKKFRWLCFFFLMPPFSNLSFLYLPYVRLLFLFPFISFLSPFCSLFLFPNLFSLALLYTFFFLLQSIYIIFLHSTIILSHVICFASLFRFLLYTLFLIGFYLFLFSFIPS